MIKTEYEKCITLEEWEAKIDFFRTYGPITVFEARKERLASR